MRVLGELTMGIDTASQDPIVDEGDWNAIFVEGVEPPPPPNGDGNGEIPGIPWWVWAAGGVGVVTVIIAVLAKRGK